MHLVSPFQGQPPSCEVWVLQRWGEGPPFPRDSGCPPPSLLRSPPGGGLLGVSSPGATE